MGTRSRLTFAGHRRPAGKGHRGHAGHKGHKAGKSRSTGALSPGAARQLALGVAATRIGLGVTAIAAPTVVGRPWIGPDAYTPGGHVLARALGGRDVALGLGPVLACRHRRPLRSWVEVAVLADLVDVGVTLVSFARLPTRSRWLVLASAVGAAGAGALAARSL